jgi:hypothetical protein
MSTVILIGASVAGKTAIARAIEERHCDEVAVFHFDQIGVPPVEQMVAEYGSGEAWQCAKTLEWMARIAPLARAGRAVLFEGQTRLAFLSEGAASVGGIEYWPLLVDCDDDTRIRRALENAFDSSARADISDLVFPDLNESEAGVERHIAPPLSCVVGWQATSPPLSVVCRVAEGTMGGSQKGPAAASGHVVPDLPHHHAAEVVGRHVPRLGGDGGGVVEAHPGI